MQSEAKDIGSSITSTKIGMGMIVSLLSVAGTACLGAKEYVDCFGLVRGLALLLLVTIRPHAEPRAVKVTIPGHSVSVLVRPGTTDVEVFNTIYRSKQYHYDFARPPKVIVDVGAYTGLSAAYFASTYPEAQIIAIEPDNANFSLLVKNTSAWANVYAIQAALWSDNGPIELIDPGNGPWAFRVAQIDDSSIAGPQARKRGRSQIQAITIPEVMSKFGISHIDLLKLDIEGSEKEVLASSLPWIANVGAVCIELHDRFKVGCSREFYKATDDFPIELRRGETVMVMRN